MNNKPIAIIISMIILSILLLWGCSHIQPSNSFGGVPHTTGLIEVNSNMKWIGYMLRDGKFYCVDNIGLDIVYDNHTKWVSMKEFCDIIENIRNIG